MRGYSDIVLRSKAPSFVHSALSSGFWVGVVLILMASLGSCGESTPDADERETGVVISPNDDRAYALVELANGLEVMLVSDPTVEKSAAALSVGLGAAADPDDYPGMAHYLEHMLFMG